MMNKTAPLLLLLIATMHGVEGQTNSPSAAPSTELLEGGVDTPTMLVTETTGPSDVLASSDIPTDVPVSDEVAEPSKAPISVTAPIPPVVIAPATPVQTTLAPFLAPVPLGMGGGGGGPKNDLCETNQACAAVNLTGLCCPTIDDQYLQCCTGFIEQTCQKNDKCADLGLEGACCPTAGNIPADLDGIYLDCCATVPDVCATEQQSRQVGPDVAENATDAPSACPRMSAVEYKEALSQSTGSTSASSITTVATVSVAVVATVVTALFL